MRYVLIDGKVTLVQRRDPPAAQRYTEPGWKKSQWRCFRKSTRILLISGLTMTSTKLSLLFFLLDFQIFWSMVPTVLPLVWYKHTPPHNLGEVIDGIVHVIDNPDTTIDELMQFIKGPDFPTGANILEYRA